MSNLAWIDLETTGLDPDVHDILEIGIIITDRELNEVAREVDLRNAVPRARVEPRGARDAPGIRAR